MSTPSFIGFHTESGIVGVSCQWDGYPEHMFPALTAIVERDGPLKSMAILIKEGERGGWSMLMPDRDRDELARLSRHSETVSIVVGYGVAYTDMEPVPPARLNDLVEKGRHGLSYAYIVSVETGAIGAYKFEQGGKALAPLDVSELMVS